MTDQHQAHVELINELVDQAENLLLDCHIHRCGGLVSNQQPGLVCQCDRDHYPLTLSSRQLVRVVFDPLCRMLNTYRLQQANGFF